VLWDVTLPQVTTQLPQVKLCLPELDVNGCFDRCDDLRFRKGNAQRLQKRTDEGAVTRRLESVGKQQARLGMVLPPCCAILDFGCRHVKPSLSTPWTPVAMLP
jgi:hypothetical protein